MIMQHGQERICKVSVCIATGAPFKQCVCALHSNYNIIVVVVVVVFNKRLKMFSGGNS